MPKLPGLSACVDLSAEVRCLSPCHSSSVLMRELRCRPTKTKLCADSRALLCRRIAPLSLHLHDLHSVWSLEVLFRTWHIPFYRRCFNGAMSLSKLGISSVTTFPLDDDASLLFARAPRQLPCLEKQTSARKAGTEGSNVGTARF